MAIMPSTTAGVEPGEPWADGNEWELCNSGDEPYSSSCAGLNVVGVWDSSMNVTSGEVYEYPAGSEMYYQVNPGSPFWSVSAPDIDMDVWSPIECPCKETWVANGQPVWVSGTAYPGNYVVEHPAGTGNLYIPLESGGVSVGGGEPGIDTHWVLCEGQGPNPGPCEGLNVAVWNDTTTATVGDIYQYPANSGLYYEVTYVDPNGLIATAPGEDQDSEFWTPYICPCKETWVANGQPVWDISTSFYAGNYVVEWPAGSGELYLAEAGGITGAGEPGIDEHWIPCEINDLQPVLTPAEDADAVGLPSIGALATLVGIVAASAFVRREYNSD